jgi:two-component system, cell cycle response regulator CtrA
LVIFGNGSIDEKITALGAGADGYLTKPFDRYELMANLDAIMRRTHSHGSATISVGNLVVDLSRNYAKAGGTRLELTAEEFQIIEFLALRKGAVLSKNAFLNHLYGCIDEPDPRIIDVFICKLRHKLVENGAEGLSVDTVWGRGYILRETRDYQMLEKAG